MAIETGPLTGAHIPPLEGGDRLTGREFERRYHAMPRTTKAELIEGVVYMPSPVRASHSLAHGRIMGWLGVYVAATPGVYLLDNATVRLDRDNVVQPDALLRVDTSRGGQSRISADDYIDGAPELIIEIAGSSAAYDLHDKLNVYRRNSVQEYLVWQIYDQRLDWFTLADDTYLAASPDPAGIIRSHVFPGLCLTVVALLNGNLANVLSVLQQGMQMDEHVAFVQRLTKE